MSVAVGFVGGRLTEARKARALAATDLAAMIEVSPTSVSKYENGHQFPRQDTVARISQTLAMPYDYFFRPLVDVDTRPVFWRARLSAPPVMLERARVRLDWMKEMVDYLAGYFDYPVLDIPKVDYPSNPALMSPERIEEVAKSVRAYWGAERGPLPDVVEKLEGSGVLISRIHVEAEKVDAFSQWSDRFGVPFIVLSRDKASAARQRFDALHEFFHIIAHRELTPTQLNNRQTYKMIERQADLFASFMLLPEADFVSELYAPTLDGMLSLKQRWGVSVGAMIMRCKSLDLLDEYEIRRTWMNYTRRGWKKGEPFDATMQPETPNLIRRSVELLLEKGVQSVSDIRKALPFPAVDLEEMADLEPGTLGGADDGKPEPQLKAEFQSNVISLFPGNS